MLDLAQKQTYPSALYIVATPIGNLADITMRAVHVLSISDYIACEDTRNSQTLLQSYNIAIKNKLISCHQHNQQQASAQIIAHLLNKKIVSYISDAGTPSISDPGAILVNAAIEHNIKIIPIGGISAVSSIVSIAGVMSTDASNSNYYFAGFLPTKNQQRLKYLQQLYNYNVPIILFESPHRIKQTLEDLKINFMGEKLIIAREISKKFEDITYTKVGEEFNNLNTKGEFCLMISNFKNLNLNLESNNIINHPQYTQINSLIISLLPLLGTKQTSQIVAKSFNLNTKDVYNLCLHFST